MVPWSPIVSPKSEGSIIHSVRATLFEWNGGLDPLRACSKKTTVEISFKSEMISRQHCIFSTWDLQNLSYGYQQTLTIHLENTFSYPSSSDDLQLCPFLSLCLYIKASFDVSYLILSCEYFSSLISLVNQTWPKNANFPSN